MSSKSVEDIIGIQVDLHPGGSYTAYLGCKDTSLSEKNGVNYYPPTLFFARSHSSSLMLFRLKEGIYRFTKGDDTFKFCEYEHGSSVMWEWKIPSKTDDPVYAYQLSIKSLGMEFGGLPLWPKNF
jgi:hypothetical protein